MIARQTQVMRSQVVFVIAAVFALGATALWCQRPNHAGAPLLQINDAGFSVKDFQEMSTQLPPLLRAALDTEEGRRKALDWIIDWKLMLSAPQRSPVASEPAVRAA